MIHTNTLCDYSVKLQFFHEMNIGLKIDTYALQTSSQWVFGW